MTAVELQTVIRWEDPPPTRSRNGGRPTDTYSSRYRGIADQLRAQPGRWALVDEFTGGHNRGLATKIRLGSMLCFCPAGDFEAVTRRGNGVVRTYARYLGDGSDS